AVWPGWTSGVDRFRASTCQSWATVPLFFSTSRTRSPLFTRISCGWNEKSLSTTSISRTAPEEDVAAGAEDCVELEEERWVLLPPPPHAASSTASSNTLTRAKTRRRVNTTNNPFRYI